MKQVIALFLINILFIFAVSVPACEISFFPDKEKYSISDTAVLKMAVKWTHKTCIKEGVEPMLKFVDIEMIAKTKFKEKSPGLWEIRYKLKVTGKKAAINAVEDCSKGGGLGSIKLQIEE